MLIYSLRNLIIGYTITIIVVLLILLYTFSTLQSQEKELTGIQRSRESLQTLGPALVNMQEFESSLFSYVNSGDKPELDFYNEGISELNKDSLQLVMIAASIPEATISLQYTQLINLQGEMKEYGSLLLDLAKTKNTDRIKAQLKKGTGASIVKTFKSVVNRLEDNDRQIISTSYGQTINLTRKTFAFVKLISTVLVIILVISFYFNYRDIGNRKRAEEKLKKFNDELGQQVNEKTKEIRNNEKKYRRLHESMMDAYAMVDMQGRVIEFNAAYKEMLGYSGEELLQKTYNDITPAKWHDLEARIIREQILEKEYSQVYEKEYIHKSGKLLPVELRTFLLNDSSGKPEAMWAIIRDISERKKAEEELRASQEELKLIYNTTNDIIFLISIDENKEYRFSSVNNAFISVTGLKQEQVIGKYVKDVIPEPSLSFVLKKYKETIQIRKPVYWEEISDYPSGRKIGIVTVSPVFNEKDECIMLVGTVHDITERKRSEETIKASQKELQLIYNTTSDIIFLVSIDDKKEYKFISVNQAFLTTTGFKAEQVNGKYMKDVIPEPSLSVVLKRYSEVIQMRKPVSWEETSEYSTGIKTAIVTISPVFNEKDECIMLVGAAHDITERKKAEKELIEAESKFRNLVEQSLIGVYIIQNGKLAYVNPQFAKIFGYTQEELIGSNPIEIILEDDKVMVAENVRSRVAGEKDSVHYEANGLKKDGGNIRIEVFCSGTLYDGSSAIIGTILDITERKRAEDKIMEANERFNLISKATNDAVWDWDVVNDRNWGNEVFYHDYGIEPGSFSNNEAFVSRVHPDDKERILKNLQKAFDNKEELILDEFHFRMPDGKYRYFYDRAFIIYNAEGKPVRMLGSMTDITNLKNAEEEKEKARYQLNERVKELTTLYQSGQILQMEQRPVKEVLQEIVSILPSGWQYPDITAACITLGKMKLATSNFAKGPHKQSAEFIAPDGEIGKIEVVYLEKKPDVWEGAFLAEERNLINMLAEMLRTYLARKQATEELMKSEANLKTIFETTDDGYALLDIDFNIVSYNQRGFDFVMNELGAKPGMGKNLIDYIPEARRSFLLKLKEEVLKGKDVNYEISYVQPDNSYKWYYIRMFSITNSEKKILGLMIAASDITAKKLMEEEILDQKVQEQKRIIRAVLKAEERERNKIGQELHDNVNQILAGTKLYLSLAEKDETGKNDLIKTSQELIDSAIREIRSLSKSQVTPLKGVNLEELIYSLVDKLRESSSLKVTVDYNVNSQVIEDDLKINIYRIIQEQTNNILKHARASDIDISIKEDHEFLNVLVEDNGKGFDSLQKRNGIGVSNMINRVESFNGELIIDSSPGKGCRLKIKIPY